MLVTVEVHLEDAANDIAQGSIFMHGDILHRSRLIVSARRTVTSLIFFSSMDQTEKTPANGGNRRPGCENPPRQRGRGRPRREETRVMAGMSGGLLFGVRLKDIRAQQFEVHQASRRYAVAPPLGNRLGRHVA